jgi:hypothetical protein
MSQENPKEQEQIDSGERVKTFVLDPAVAGAIARLASQNYDEFKKAVTDDEVRMAHARGVVLDGFVDALQGIIDVGTGAKIQRNDRERRELANSANVRPSRVKPV